MRKAAREGSTFHMWFHPFNLATDPDNLFEGIRAILEEFRCLKESGLMVSQTMGQIADSLNLTDPVPQTTENAPASVR